MLIESRYYIMRDADITCTMEKLHNYENIRRLSAGKQYATLHVVSLLHCLKCRSAYSLRAQTPSFPPLSTFHVFVSESSFCNCTWILSAVRVPAYMYLKVPYR